MVVDDLFEADIIVVKTIWSKRANNVTKHSVESKDRFEIKPRNRIEVIDAKDD